MCVCCSSWLSDNQSRQKWPRTKSTESPSCHDSHQQFLDTPYFSKLIIAQTIFISNNMLSMKKILTANSICSLSESAREVVSESARKWSTSSHISTRTVATVMLSHFCSLLLIGKKLGTDIVQVAWVWSVGFKILQHSCKFTLLKQTHGVRFGASTTKIKNSLKPICDYILLPMLHSDWLPYWLSFQ